MQFLLTISYDGTDYAGWQRQDNAVAVQEKVEDALGSIIGRPVSLRAASRTDAGVHALGQRASFFAPDLRVPTDKLPQVLNGLLPVDISVVAAAEVPPNFNPRFDAKQKTYIYNVQNSPHANPLLSRYAAHVPQELDFSAMQNAVKHFVGAHDFAAFCATGSNAKTTVREIFACEVIGGDASDAWASSPSFGGRPSLFAPILGAGSSSRNFGIRVVGSGFLYNMVRIIAGTVLYVGMGKISAEDIAGIIASKDRARAGKTMPPQGLVLVEVVY
ncbi:MAG: tRNA pseudouridine synthase A [Defluviitaleaceae bacterium]|nr:tRNA pseudouridine synthase A [Defluviitaleaceae bacterium]